MLDALPKAFFSLLAGSQTLKHAASRYGMRRPDSFARRFVAGEQVADAIAAAQVLEQNGLAVTLDLLGESVSSTEAAGDATRAYLSTIQEIERGGISRNISLKLTQLGLGVDRATSVDNLRRVLDAAGKHGFFVRIDMENSPYTAQTLETFETTWGIGYRNVGVVLQSYLRRSMDDARRMIALGVPVRLVKGAYREPRSVAFQRKTDVDAAYLSLMQVLLREGKSPAIATHDPEHDRGDARVRRRARHRQGPLRVPDALRHPPRPAVAAHRIRGIACGSTCRLAASGFRISCGGWASGRRTRTSC